MTRETIPQAAVPKVGDKVRVVLRPSHLVAFRKSVENRVGNVESVFTPMGAHEPRWRVVFPPRRRNAQPLVHFFSDPDDMEVVTDA